MEYDKKVFRDFTTPWIKEKRKIRDKINSNLKNDTILFLKDFGKTFTFVTDSAATMRKVFGV